MQRFPPWKRALILGICALGLLLTVPNFIGRATLDALPDWLPKRQMILGLDLQGGSHLLLEVDLAPLYRERLETLVGDVRAALRGAQIGYRGLGVQGGSVALTLTDPAQADRAREVLDGLNEARLSLTGTSQRDYELESDGARLTMALTEVRRQELATSALTQSLEVVRRRIDELGTREASIQRQGANRILVQVPGERDPANIKRLLGRTARLTFHMVDLQGDVEAARQGRVPPGDLLLQSADAEAGPEWLLVRRQVDLSGENLVDAQPSFQDNEPVVSFRLDSAGARTFGRLTQNNVGQLFAIVLDDKVISAPRIREPILGGSGIISGSFTVESANELAVLLRAGALPAPLSVVEERSVGPELGADSIRAGVIACIVAGVLVMGYMVFYYGIFGMVANLALLANLILVLGIMSVLNATLTLPGIAGLVLVIGQAVNSNVLIYERIREEARSGRTPLSAINSGFDEALRTIVDANLTSLIAGLALFFYGTGPVRGFAVTQCIGIVTTMFTAVTFTRLVVAYWYQRRRPTAIPL